MNENATPTEKIDSRKCESGMGGMLASLPADGGLTFASLRRRLVAMFYDALLLVALLMVAGFAYIPVFGVIQSGFQKAVFQLYLLIVMGVYFVVFWSRGGQTLAMKTWRIRLVMTDGGVVPVSRCMLRYALAFVGLLAAGAGYLWVLFDHDRQFLHDRIAQTRIILDSSVEHV